MPVIPLSYSHDLTREEILTRFPKRVAAAKRVKLFKPELDQLILHFLDRLRELEDEKAILALCQSEIALLEEGYAQSTVAFDYIPKYRQAIQGALDSGFIPVTPSNSHRYLHTQRVTGVQQERFEHYALSYFKYDEATCENLDSRSQQTNRTRQLKLKAVNPWRYLDKLKKLLHSQHKFAAHHQAIAIAGLTGRRIGEVTARGRFPCLTILTCCALKAILKWRVRRQGIISVIAWLMSRESFWRIEASRSASMVNSLCLEKSYLWEKPLQLLSVLTKPSQHSLSRQRLFLPQ